MATTSLIPLSEYLGHSFSPDRDYIDGELQERNLGELDHGELQTRITSFLLAATTSGTSADAFAGADHAVSSSPRSPAPSTTTPPDPIERRPALYLPQPPAAAESQYPGLSQFPGRSAWCRTPHYSRPPQLPAWKR